MSKSELFRVLSIFITLILPPFRVSFSQEHLAFVSLWTLTACVVAFIPSFTADNVFINTVANLSVIALIIFYYNIITF